MEEAFYLKEADKKEWGLTSSSETHFLSVTAPLELHMQVASGEHP